MRLDDYHEKEGKRVWLTVDEMNMLIDEASTLEQKMAFQLAGKAGLRRSEITSVTINDFLYAPDGFLRIWEDYSKGEKYREVPIPDELETSATNLRYQRDPDKPVIYNTNENDAYSGSSVYKWVKKAAKKKRTETDDKGWKYLDVHDLRRSWGGHLLWNCGLSPMAVMQFGGWSDWATFQEHYMGEMSPEAMERERSKIDYMGGEAKKDEVLMEPASEAAQQTYYQS